jgi:hypothetical protein
MALKARKTGEDVLYALVTAWNAKQEADVSTKFHADKSQLTTYTNGNTKAPVVTTEAVATAVIANDIDSIKLAVATDTNAAEYTTSELDGVFGDEDFDESRYVVVTTSSTVGAFNADDIVFTGLLAGEEVTDTITLTAVNGGETLYGDQLFDSITMIEVTAMADTDGTISFGTAAVPECIARANECKSVLNRHFASTQAHNTAVSSAISTADATTLATANTLATAIKSAFNTHLGAANVHFNNDGTNTVSSSNATTIATLITLCNELDGDINAHIADAPSGYMIELVDP